MVYSIYLFYFCNTKVQNIILNNIMKKLINVVLGVCALAMLWICYRSISDQQSFETEVKQRELAVKARLIEIRQVEDAYKEQHKDDDGKGYFCGDWDTLIAFIKDGQLPTVIKQGVLTEDQMEKGLTEAKAAAIVNRGNQAEIAANGLQGFRRDTIWVSLLDSLFDADYNVDEIRYIPYSDANGGPKKEFDLIATMGRTKSDDWIYVMECSATFDTYLVGSSKLWKREAANRTEVAEGMGNFPGLKIGEASAVNWNNNAGNWE